MNAGLVCVNISCRPISRDRQPDSCPPCALFAHEHVSEARAIGPGDEPAVCGEAGLGVERVREPRDAPPAWRNDEASTAPPTRRTIAHSLLTAEAVRRCPRRQPKPSDFSRSSCRRPPRWLLRGKRRPRPQRPWPCNPVRSGARKSSRLAGPIGPGLP
jgi:hypothetical protein